MVTGADRNGRGGVLERASRIFVAGHRGMVGSAICRRLERGGYANLLTRTREELDLLDQRAVTTYLRETRPDYIVLAAARVGGIHANNTHRAEFIYENLGIQLNVIHAAHEAGVPQLLFLGSSCIYPRDCPQPIREEYILTGPLEHTNEPYAVAKIAGVRMCDAYREQYGRDYISVMPTNLFGPNDNYDLQSAHVLPALLRKAHEAKVSNALTLTVWGSGTPRREFLYVDDLADACVFLMERQGRQALPGLLNIGWGEDVTIGDLADLIVDVVGFRGRVVFDTTKPDGTPRKLLDSSRIAGLGWRPATPLRTGIARAYQHFLGECAG